MAALASLAFVAAPSASPTITLNLDQPGLVKVLADSFSLGGLDWDGDPETGTGSYATRQVEFTLQFTGTYEEAASAIQAAVRQLTQPAAGFDRRNWLMFRWVGGQPFFLEMFPTSVGSLNWRQSGAGVWEMPVSVMCAFGFWGAPEDIASFTITNSPSSGTNRMIVGPSVLGTIKGDLETPLMLANTAASQGGLATDPYYFNSYALRGGFTHSLLARDLTELTSGTDVGASVSGAGANYIDGNYKSCSFAAASLVQRLSGTFSTTLTPMPGLYRALVRVVLPGVAGSHTIDYGFAISFSGSSGIYTDTVTREMNADVGDLAFWIDLGVAQIHSNSDFGALGLSAAASTSEAPSVSIKASASVVTGSVQPLRFDELLLLPVSTTYGSARLALINTGATGATTTRPLVFDSVNDAVKYVFDATTTTPFAAVPALLNGAAPSWIGGLPTVVPGANNYLTVVTRGVSTSANTMTFTGRYYPRYAHAKPSAT